MWKAKNDHKEEEKERNKDVSVEKKDWKKKNKDACITANVSNVQRNFIRKARDE